VEEPTHHLIDFLPAVFRQSQDLQAFLTPFQAIFVRSESAPETSGDAAAAQHPSRSLEDQIGRIPSLLNPADTPEDFLSWLAQWASISLYPDARDRRRLVAQMIPLYRSRGTKEYVEQVLRLYVDGNVAVEEDELPGMAVGVAARTHVGLNPRPGDDPFRFTVTVEFSTVPPGRHEGARLVALARRVIDLAKPAYTHYRLQHNLPERERGFVVSVRSRLGFDTVLDHAAPVSRLPGGL